MSSVVRQTAVFTLRGYASYQDASIDYDIFAAKLHSSDCVAADIGRFFIDTTAYEVKVKLDDVILVEDITINDKTTYMLILIATVTGASHTKQTYEALSDIGKYISKCKAKLDRS